ncbi:catalase [Helicobacter labetoulli]|uniref:catalase n=1 Tax=Helicobacter labetoulli TaxID=2315333 RepID=UPI000EF6EABE|nr:catalase [Helicobacter labetoulli]
MFCLRKTGKCIVSGLLIAAVSAYANEAKQYDAEGIADVFYALNGDSKDPHKKINHTKGFCANGEFIPVDNITKTLNIPLLKEKSINTLVRYSLGGAMLSDKSKPRGMALKIQGQQDEWEIVMLNTEINFAKNPQEFGEFFAMRIPKDDKVDTAYITKRTSEVASYKNFEEYMKNVGITGSVANTMYHSIHTFYFKDSKNKLIPARFKFVPASGVAYLKENELQKLSNDFLESDFKEKAKKAPIAYKMILVLANPKDKTDDTTALWSGKHKEIEVGTLLVKEHRGDVCNGDVFMPSMLPNGVEAPKDPLFDIRNETYGITFGRRQ